MPVAKIINKKWFYGLQFFTNRWTLDPRPDSETLVEAVLKNERVNYGVKILDLGTGTGCLLCAIIANIPGSVGVGIDKSFFARRVAMQNVCALGLKNRIKIAKGTFLTPLNENEYFDIIISNPPYIPIGKQVNDGARHDPKIALYGGKDGLKFYRQIAKALHAPPGVALGRQCLYLEIGVGQERNVRRIFKNAGWKFIANYRDLSGRIRVLQFGA